MQDDCVQVFIALLFACKSNIVSLYYCSISDLCLIFTVRN